MKRGKTPRREPKREPDKEAQRKLLQKLREKRTKRLIIKGFRGRLSDERKREINNRANSVINETIMKIISMSRKRKLEISKRTKSKIVKIILNQMEGLEITEQHYFLTRLVRQASEEAKAARARKEEGRETLMKMLEEFAVKFLHQERFVDKLREMLG